MRRLSSLIALVVLCSISFAQSPHGKDFSTNCSDCHTTEGWKIDRKSLAFNHDTIGFPLEGQHKLLDCRMCHKTLLFTNTKTECMSCHTDIHYQTVGFECERCHTPKSWIVENITEIHQLSRFPLVGPHVTADCYSCHPSASLLQFEPLGVECFDCHKDKYYATTQPNHVQGGYSTNCEECHLMTSFDWSGANINHSFFPLTGGHGSIDCIACHTSGQFSKIPAECVACHQADYNSTSDPNHSTLGFSTNCNDCHDLTPGWKPARFNDHDAQFFPIYSGSHNGTWNSCTECHPNTGDYSVFSCINCHNNQGELNDKHNDVGGYAYNDQACFECHPSGSSEGGFNHNASNFPLTGAHITTECNACHTNGFAGTPTICFACHENDYNQSVNPNHSTIGIATECETCHTTLPDWTPALYPNHNEKFPLQGAHITAANCFSCHEGNYVNTPNLCFGCHSDKYNQSSNPNHIAAQFSTSCETCHNEYAWTPATFDHDGQYFPVYSGKHQGTWDVCSDCHTNSSDYSVFTCTSTCHVQGPTNEQHKDVGGYSFNDAACFECHPDGSAEGAFNHQTSIFPLTGAHLTTDCIQCHANGFSGTPTICFACHEIDFNQSVNPNHGALGIPTDCATCHTTNPDWQPASFPIHNNYYQLQGAHAGIASNCFICHEGNYINTPNLCFGCHSDDYNQANNPNHIAAQFPTNCESCHSETAWTPATFDHDGQFFPINSGKHLGTWDVCSDCHTNSGDYSIFTCITCHQQGPTGNDHNGVGGYSYNSPACLECHPDGSAEGAFNHNNSNFPLTGAHITTDCISCHANGYAGTPTICFACHEPNFDQSVNPNHSVLGIPNDCEVCHTTIPDWKPAAFPIHNNYYPLIGEHVPIANDCNSCHGGDYNNTPNVCAGCHMDKYNQTTNPDHDAIAIPTDCETCHTPSPDWQPASFPIHNNYYALTGAHLTIASECYTCHQGDYNNTPNACVGCHMANYSQTTNPDHDAIGIGTDCQTCHTTVPGWQPATFPIHNQYWPLTGAHVNTECYECHAGNYNSTPNTCAGCHMDDYNGTTDPNHAAAGFPTTCEECHTTVAWVPSTFDHDGQYFPIYSGSHNGVWNTCSQCHPNPSNFGVFTCTTSCHPQGETNQQHQGVSGYSYNSDACYACHPTGQSGEKCSGYNLNKTKLMKFILPILLFIFLGLNLKGQTADEPIEGAISYLTSQNVYVKFKSTENMAVGDTLFVKQGGTNVPALVVTNLSSISAVCTPISSVQFKVDDKITARQKPKTAPVKEVPVQKVQDGKPRKEAEVKPLEDKTGGQTAAEAAAQEQLHQDITGRLSVSSYLNFSNTPGGDSQRMRYTFSLNAKNIANSKLSGETYISFVHKIGEWSEIQNNIFNGLKIYSLALNYQFNNSLRVWVGRKINPRISNMGAIDGIQFEAKIKSITLGILAGSRPDYQDYSVNFNLFQYGAYLSHDLVTRKGSMQSSLAFAEQKNNGKTDRRFVYFQHSNSLVKNLYFFGTVECDLYRYDTVNEKPQSTFNLTNFYVSLRWRVIRQLSLSASYSARQNIVYYETYKTILDQILDPETLQGYMLQVSYNPIKYLSIGARPGYRFRKSDLKPSKNLYAYVTYSRIPVLKISATLSATLLETSYISGKIYSLSISRDLVAGKLYAGLGYHYVDYHYFNTDSSIPQNMAEFNLNWNIYKKLCLSLNYEGTFEKVNQYSRFYINITQRF